MIFAQFRSDLKSWRWNRTELGREHFRLYRMERGLPIKERYWPTWWLALSFAYNMVRWVLLRDMHVDPNEDFNCGHCSKPVLRRWMYCSDACWVADERENAHGRHESK
jgi:hypothetical protein